MFAALLAVALVAGGSTESPLQLCTGDHVQLGRGYDMHAVGNVRCMVGDVLLLGDEVEVYGSTERSNVRFVAKGSGRISHAHGTMRADRITVDMKDFGGSWQVRRMLLEYAHWQLVPAEPGG